MTSLPRSAKVMQLSAALKVDRLKALGAAVDWFCWVDEQCADGCTKLTPRQVDEVLGIKRLSDALASIGWAHVGEDGLVYVVDFDHHNGETAKSRAQNAERQARFKSNARSVTKSNAKSVTGALANALPRIDNIYSKEGDGNATLDSECGADASAERQQRAHFEMGYGSWVRRVCAVLPQLAQMRTLPPDVDAAARVMHGTGYAPSDVELRALGRFWAAPECELGGIHRPNAFRWVMESLPEVCRNAQEWCRIDDRKRRKAAATARRRAQEAAAPVSGVPVTEADKKAFFEGLRGVSTQEGGSDE